MQAIANGEILDVAKMGVELGDSGPIGFAAQQAAFGGEAVAPGTLDDFPLEML